MSKWHDIYQMTSEYVVATCAECQQIQWFKGDKTNALMLGEVQCPFCPTSKEKELFKAFNEFFPILPQLEGENNNYGE